MAFNPYSPENRTLTITRDDPWGTHVGYDTKLTGGIIARPTMSNHRFTEIQMRIGLPLALEAKSEMMTTFTALSEIPKKFGLVDDDDLAWRSVAREIGDVYRHEKSYFDRMRRPIGGTLVSAAEIAGVYDQMLDTMQAGNESLKDAAERIATWIELAGLVEVPQGFAEQQQRTFIESVVGKEKMWDYTGIQVW